MPEIRDVHESIDLQEALAPDYAAEEFRERRWNDFMTACQEFASEEPQGWAAVLKAVAMAMNEQRELPYGR